MTFRERYRIFSESRIFRVLLHIGFWVVYLSIPMYMYLIAESFSNNWIMLIGFLNIIYTGFYYFFAYFLVPRFFRSSKLHIFILCTVALYVLLFYCIQATELFALDHFQFTDYDKDHHLVAASQRKIYYFPQLLQIVIVTAIPLSLKFMRSFYRLQDERNKLSRLNTRLELDFLKSQLNPHFLFNSLNNIYALALAKSDKAPEMIIKLSDLMRYMLYECNVDKNDLLKEISFMRAYIDLEKIRHGENVEISFTEEGDMKGKKIPPLLLVPFIENAFKHGINAQFGKSWVHIHIKAGARSLLFKSENNKPFKGQTLSKFSGGIGIENTKKRLEIIYPDHYKLNIDENSSTYSVTLEISDTA